MHNRTSAYMALAARFLPEGISFLLLVVFMTVLLVDQTAALNARRGAQSERSARWDALETQAGNENQHNIVVYLRSEIEGKTCNGRIVRPEAMFPRGDLYRAEMNWGLAQEAACARQVLGEIAARRDVERDGAFTQNTLSGVIGRAPERDGAQSAK